MDFTKVEHYEKEYLDTHHDSALAVTSGVENQPMVNPHFVRKRKRQLTTDEYVEGILNRNITILSQAITLIESNNPDHYAQAQQIIERCLPYAGNSVRIGITGALAVQWSKLCISSAGGLGWIPSGMVISPTPWGEPRR